MSKPTFASVTEEPCTCRVLERQAQEPSSPIKFNPDLNEYNIEYQNEHGSGSIRIYHCMFCGGAAPKSQAERLFTAITSAEQDRLFVLTSGVRTVTDLLQVLGEPDEERAGGVRVGHDERDGSAPTAEAFRLLIYTRLSETIDLWFTVRADDTVQVQLQGKYIGPSKA